MKTRKLQRRGVSIICLVALLATALVNGLAQDRGSGTKRSLTHQDYDSWRSIHAPQISRDGKFIAYAFMAQDGDSEIVVRNRATGAEWRAPRGYRPPAPPPDESVPNFAEIVAGFEHLAKFRSGSRNGTLTERMAVPVNSVGCESWGYALQRWHTGCPSQPAGDHPIPGSRRSAAGDHTWRKNVEP